MARKVKLTRKKLGWVGNRDVNLKGLPLKPNAGIEASYYKKIMQLLNPMAKEYEAAITKALKGQAAKEFAQDASLTSEVRIIMNSLTRKYDKIFSEHAKSYADFLMKKSLDSSSRTLGASLKELSGGLTIKTDMVTGGDLAEVVKASVLENTDLIKSISSQYSEQVRGDVLRSITSPDSGGLKGLQDRLHSMLSKRYQMQRNRAKNIALDQTRKVYNNVNAERMKAVGVSKFVWHHSGGSQKPRRDHINMDGNVYSFDDLPIIDPRTGEIGIPGQAVNCKCFMTPVISFEDGQESS